MKKSVNISFGKLFFGVILFFGVVVLGAGGVSGACTCNGAITDLTIIESPGSCPQEYGLVGNFLAFGSKSYYLCSREKNVVEGGILISALFLSGPYDLGKVPLDPCSGKNYEFAYQVYEKVYVLCSYTKQCGNTVSYFDSLSLVIPPSCPSGFSPLLTFYSEGNRLMCDKSLWSACSSCGDGTCNTDETCSSCVADCGKCDGVTCSSSSECKGGYCCGSPLTCHSSSCSTPCTSDSQCTGGAYSDLRCDGTKKVNCIALGGCFYYVSTDCADNNVCTTEESCSNPDGIGGDDAICTYTNAVDGTSCDGGTKICVGGTCISPTASCSEPAECKSECGDGEKEITTMICSGSDECCAEETECVGVGLQCKSECDSETENIVTELTCSGEDKCCANKATCPRNCDGKVCGDDGCGGICGDCPTGQSCDNTLGDCVDCSTGSVALSWLDEDGDLIEEDEKAYTGQTVNARVSSGAGCAYTITKFDIYEDTSWWKTFDDLVVSYLDTEKGETDSSGSDGTVSKEWEIEDDADEANYYFKLKFLSGEEATSENLEVIQCAEGYVRGGATYDIETCDDYNRLGNYAREQCETCGTVKIALEELEEYIQKNPSLADKKNFGTARCYWGGEAGVDSTKKCRFAVDDNPGLGGKMCSYEVTAEECKVDDDIRTISYYEKEIDIDGNFVNPNTCDTTEITETIPCPRSTRLPFFSWVNLIAIVTLIAVIYLIWNYLGKRKKRLGKKKSRNLGKR